MLRKLKLFKEIALVENMDLIEKEKSFQINIQEYYIYKNLKIKQFLVEKIGKSLLSGEVHIQVIRTILRHFKFVYRYIYHELIEDIIKEVKG